MRQVMVVKAVVLIIRSGGGRLGKNRLRRCWSSTHEKMSAACLPSSCPRTLGFQGPERPRITRTALPRVLRLTPSTSVRSACLTCSGLPWADSGGPTDYYAIGDCAGSVSDRTLCSAPPALQAPMGDCGPRGGAGDELLGTTLFGTAGRRPNRDYGPRRGPRRKLPGATRPSSIDCGPFETRAVSGLR